MQGERGARRLIQGFFDFAFSGNILEIAFGLMFAAPDPNPVPLPPGPCPPGRGRESLEGTAMGLFG